MCGEFAPLVPYHSTTQVYVDENGETAPKTYNFIWDLSYPASATGKRSRTPDKAADGVWNFTMVQSTCSVPVKPFMWNYKQGNGGAPPTITDRSGVPSWLPDDRIDPFVSGRAARYTADGVARWCEGCAHKDGYDVKDRLTTSDASTGLTVSIMNKRLLAMSSVDAMGWFDWVALLLCSYIVGLQVVGEIKDTALCEMLMERNIKELPQHWKLALAVLNRLRSQVFLQPLLASIPLVVLTQGGGALNVCFNTIAVLFITEVDNLSYQFGLGEREKERVDTYGYVVLTDLEARQLSRSKAMCVVITVVFTLWLVDNGASIATIFSAALCALSFKLSELATTYKHKSGKEIAIFVAVSVVTQVLAVGVITESVLDSIYGWDG